MWIVTPPAGAIFFFPYWRNLTCTKIPTPPAGFPGCERAINERRWFWIPRAGKILPWRWEGSTLVVDTTNYSPKSNLLGSAENLHVVERFTRVAADRINYGITLTDPTTWERPWTAVVHLKQSNANIYEYACHEGNQHVMTDILAGARATER